LRGLSSAAAAATAALSCSTAAVEAQESRPGDRTARMK
jgi:hypothetical protein